MKLQDGVHADAVFSPDRRHRYMLTRDWFPKRGKGHVVWVMLNPSTATAEEDDPTIRRCQTFARQWGYDGITVANIYGLRATDPQTLLRDPEPVGEANDDILATLAEAAGVGLVMAAWGAHPATTMGWRAGRVTQIITASGRDIHCLGQTKNGSPRHPLYVPGSAVPLIWRNAHRADV